MPVVKTSEKIIINKAFRMFLERGYYCTTVMDHSTACGIEKPRFHYYIKSKQDLRMAIRILSKSTASKTKFAYDYFNRQIT